MWKKVKEKILVTMSLLGFCAVFAGLLSDLSYRLVFVVCGVGVLFVVLALIFSSKDTTPR